MGPPGKVMFPVVLGRSRLQNQTLDGGAEVVLRVPPGETLWMLPKGVPWHVLPRGDGRMNPDATRPDDPVWTGFVEAAGGGGAGAAAAEEPESRKESLGGPGETGDAVETGDMVLGIGDFRGNHLSSTTCLTQVLLNKCEQLCNSW